MTPAAAGHTPRIEVVLAQALVALFPQSHARVSVAAASVAGVIDALDARWPGMGDRLRDTSPAIRRHINVFCDGRRLALADRLDDGATVYILTAVSGG